jgi:hypothetical protein
MADEDEQKKRKSFFEELGSEDMTGDKFKRFINAAFESGMIDQREYKSIQANQSRAATHNENYEYKNGVKVRKQEDFATTMQRNKDEGAASVSRREAIQQGLQEDREAARQGRMDALQRQQDDRTLSTAYTEMDRVANEREARPMSSVVAGITKGLTGDKNGFDQANAAMNSEEFKDSGNVEVKREADGRAYTEVMRDLGDMGFVKTKVYRDAEDASKSAATAKGPGGEVVPIADATNKLRIQNDIAAGNLDNVPITPGGAPLPGASLALDKPADTPVKTAATPDVEYQPLSPSQDVASLLNQPTQPDNAALAAAMVPQTPVSLGERAVAGQMDRVAEAGTPTPQPPENFSVDVFGELTQPLPQGLGSQPSRNRGSGDGVVTRTPRPVASRPGGKGGNPMSPLVTGSGGNTPPVTPARPSSSQIANALTQFGPGTDMQILEQMRKRKEQQQNSSRVALANYRSQFPL